MSQASKGSIHIHIGELEVLVQQLEQFKDAVDGQKRHIPQMQRGLDHAISGTAINIEKFDVQFDSWLKLLENVLTDVDIAYSTLKTVLEAAREYDIGDVFEALTNGSKALIF